MIILSYNLRYNYLRKARMDAGYFKISKGEIMVISHNMSALFSQRIESVNTQNLQKSAEKLSSGQKINRAGDDAAGLAISEKMRAQIRGLNQASKNIGNGVSFLQVSEGYLAETNDILQRIRELAVQSSNGIYSDEDRAQISVEVSQLVAEVDRIASQSQFNGMTIFTGRFGADTNGINFAVGANMDQYVNVKVGPMDATTLGLKGTQDGGAAISVDSQENANMTIGVIDEALKAVTKQRADLGSYQNRFETAQKGVDVAAENLQASESRIRDTDFASELVEYTKNAVLENASVAMLAQANNSSQNVLALLRS